MKLRIITLGKKCAACGTERQIKKVMYHPESLEPYCESPYKCNDDHPNSPKNIIARSEYLVMLPFEEAQKRFLAWLKLNHPDLEETERIRKMCSFPISIRITDVAMAQFLLSLEKKMEFKSMSNTIKYCIESLMNAKDGYYTEKRQIQEKIREQKKTEEIVQSVENVLNGSDDKEEVIEDEFVF